MSNGMINLSFDGTFLNDFDCYVFRKETDKAPAREQDAISVPGRSGSLIMDRRRYPNVEMTYTLTFFDEAQFVACKGFLLSKVGYKTLRDSEHSDEFYMAYVSEDIVPVVSYDRKMIKAEVTFSRKPQRYLNSGMSNISMVAGTLTNPTLFTAYPIIQVYGTGGRLVVGDRTVDIKSIDNSYITIDCDLMDAYYKTQNLNSQIVLSSGHKFPELLPGANSISFQKLSGKEISNIQIQPRWWRL